MYLIHRASSLALLLGAALTGCPETQAATDAAVTVDASPASDSGAAMSDLDRCRAAAAALASTCMEPTRDCLVSAYATYCNEAAQPGLYAQALDCLRVDSSPTSCRTFSDPSVASEACVAAVYERVSNPRLTATMTRINALCEGRVVANRTEPLFWALSEEQLRSVEPCLSSATACSDVGTCFATIRAPITACEAP